MDRLLDEERAGPVYLRMPAVVNVVITWIRKGTPGNYPLHSWVVMPNHVHLLLTPNDSNRFERRINCFGCPGSHSG
jgi:REP element-mobilizing transposase RayT